MDILTAIRNSVSFPLEDNQVEVIAVKRGLDTNLEYSKDVALSKEFELVYADVLRLIVTQPNVSEGGVSISVSDKATLVSIANRVYGKYDEPIIQDTMPIVEPIYD